MGRILGIDYGDKRIGVAISDPGNKIALEYCLLDNLETSDTIFEINKIIVKEQIDTIAIGIPLGLKNIVTKQTDDTFKFIEKLQTTSNVKIEQVDERYTSKIALDFIKNKKRSKIGDKDIKSAQIILQDYLDKINK